MTESNGIQTDQQLGSPVVITICKVPKENHDTLSQVSKQSRDLFGEYGVSSEFLQINNSKAFEGEGMEAFTSITNLIPVNQNEEIWVNIQSYKDQEHAREVIAKLEKDERMLPLYRQFIDNITPGSKVVAGDFTRLNL